MARRRSSSKTPRANAYKSPAARSGLRRLDGRAIRELCPALWDAESRNGGAAEDAEFASSQGADTQPAHSQGDILPVSGGTTKRQHESRRGGHKRHSPQERRRKFLAPLAVGFTAKFRRQRAS